MEKTRAQLRPLAFLAQNSRLDVMNLRKPLIHSIFGLLRPGVLRELDLIKSIEKSSTAAIKNVQHRIVAVAATRTASAGTAKKSYPTPRRRQY